jgi:hypothetical protein
VGDIDRRRGVARMGKMLTMIRDDADWRGGLDLSRRLFHAEAPSHHAVAFHVMAGIHLMQAPRNLSMSMAGKSVVCGIAAPTWQVTRLSLSL